ncbi:uncharacterized protein N7529_011739 [Penicillium soppii]|uniref:uncharacterized protein n=1 Tax=Penicillium soppii TaxID=69789 RepID=UPI0025483DE2|nr:uncharacterized protein N7529_011739 [Penicillium soppii]KAJ5852354.1 hypothetical protein N7529_011739 [Penicillium soppii]
MFAMTSLMNIAHRAFGEQDPWGHELFQLPLFMTGIETKDRIHVEWIISKMSRLRFRTALSEIISIQDRMGRRLSMARVKQILEDLAREGTNERSKSKGRPTKKEAEKKQFEGPSVKPSESAMNVVCSFNSADLSATYAPCNDSLQIFENIGMIRRNASPVGRLVQPQP